LFDNAGGTQPGSLVQAPVEPGAAEDRFGVVGRMPVEQFADHREHREVRRDGLIGEGGAQQYQSLDCELTGTGEAQRQCCAEGDADDGEWLLVKAALADRLQQFAGDRGEGEVGRFSDQW
jgi:hypothetical protein